MVACGPGAVPEKSRHDQKRAPNNGGEPACDWACQQPGQSGCDQDDGSSGARAGTLRLESLEHHERRGCDGGEKEDVIELHWGALNALNR